MALLINNDVSKRVLKMSDAVPAMESAFRQLANGCAAYQPRTDFWSPTAVTGDYYRWGSLLGVIQDPPTLAFRFKSDILCWEKKDDLITESWHNVRPGLFCGFVLLFDTSNGELIALLNDGVLQHVRVGATAGVGAKYLARSDSSVLAMLGSGGMARTYAEAICAVRPIEEIRVFSPTPANRERYATEMSETLKIPVRVSTSVRDAVCDADVVAACTDSITPVFTSDMLDLVRPGAFLVRCRADEFDTETFKRVDRVVSTSKDGFIEYAIGSEADRKRRPQTKGYRRRYEAEAYDTLADVIAGRAPGRANDKESIFYYNQSAGIQFAAIGRLVFENAKAQGLGMQIPLEWFTQDIRN
jgi:ornithine cyclodeaminase/alanine dehydrogenase-like protein (mu-crystallin family)